MFQHLILLMTDNGAFYGYAIFSLFTHLLIDLWLVLPFSYYE
jgi:hypothetical protein